MKFGLFLGRWVWFGKNNGRDRAQLVADLPTRKSRLKSRPVHVGFVVHKIPMGRVPFPNTSISHVSIISDLINIHWVIYAMKHNEGFLHYVSSVRSPLARSANNSQTITFAHNLQRLFSVKCLSLYDEAIINYKSVITSALLTCFCTYFPPTLSLPDDSRSLALSPALQLSIHKEPSMHN